MQLALWVADSVFSLFTQTSSAFFCFVVQSQGAEIVNALALFFLLLLDLFMIGRQERLKCREVERRLQTIIDKINGEVSFICLLFAFVFSSRWIFLKADHLGY